MQLTFHETLDKALLPTLGAQRVVCLQHYALKVGIKLVNINGENHANLSKIMPLPWFFVSCSSLFSLTSLMHVLVFVLETKDT